jgi:hypothetical protein
MREEPLPIVAVLTLLLRSMTALADGLAPLIASAAAFVQQLRERCPEAFDENGQLRPGWQEIVEAKFGAVVPVAPARRVATPAIHTGLATRKITVHLN